MSKILVIDDDEPLRSVLAAGLKNRGFKVLEAGKATDGIALARTRSPDVILCDLNMEQTDGAATLIRLRQDPATARIPFILMTGQLAEASSLQAGPFKADELLPKPFTLDGVLAAIESSLAQKEEVPLPPPAPESSARSKIGHAQSRQGVSRATGKSVPSSPSLEPSREQLGALSARLQSLLEEERSRVARAIHDDLTQKLTVLALDLALLDSNLNDPAGESSLKQCRESVKKLSRLVNDVIQSAQTIMAELHPKVLDEFGLVAALEWFTQQFQKRTGIRFDLQVASPDVSPEAEVAKVIYRLVQEILSNVAEHANASAISMLVEERAGELRLEVKDNGKGITTGQISDPKSLGLLAMRERTEQLGGEFKIIGRPGKGTTVVVQIPLKPGTLH